LLTFYVRSSRENLADRHDSDDHPAIVEVEVDPLDDRAEKICGPPAPRRIDDRIVSR
jgi:hypothetical protein